MFNIVLVEPEIPQNTGNIARTCAATNTILHLVEPMGFKIDDKKLKRAGLDYWHFLDIRYYDSTEDFFEKNKGGEFFYFTTKAVNRHSDVEYPDNAYLVFGRESAGLPQEFYEKYRDRMRIIPMPGEFFRSINLANSVSIALYEAMRQTRSIWDK